MSAHFKAEFPYREVDVAPFRTSTRVINIFRPIVPVIILYGSRLARTGVLIDSGADFNVFHGDVATYLGITLKRGSKRAIYGLKGSIVGYEHKVKMRIAEKTFSCAVTFSDQMPNNSLAVLGNKGFFDKFTVVLDYRKKVIRISG